MIMICLESGDMSIPLAISLSSALLFSGTAACPVKDAPGLTANALYDRTKPVISVCVLPKHLGRRVEGHCLNGPESVHFYLERRPLL